MLHTVLQVCEALRKGATMRSHVMHKLRFPIHWRSLRDSDSTLLNSLAVDSRILSWGECPHVKNFEFCMIVQHISILSV